MLLALLFYIKAPRQRMTLPGGLLHSYMALPVQQHNAIAAACTKNLFHQAVRSRRAISPSTQQGSPDIQSIRNWRAIFFSHQSRCRISSLLRSSSRSSLPRSPPFMYRSSSLRASTRVSFRRAL